MADLTGANLSQANLIGANLSGASLTEANLELANLHRANLIQDSLESVRTKVESWAQFANQCQLIYLEEKIMAGINTQKNKHFCIFDYYLDGEYLKWEEVEGECPVLIAGQQWTVNFEDGTQVTGEVTEIVSISETEHKILLCSC